MKETMVFGQLLGGSVNVGDVDYHNMMLDNELVYRFTLVKVDDFEYVMNSCKTGVLDHTVIEKVIDARLVSDRCSIAKDYELNVEELPMGSGGVGQFKVMADGTLRVQIGYGKGKYNYAMCVVVQPDQN